MSQQRPFLVRCLLACLIALLGLLLMSTLPNGTTAQAVVTTTDQLLAMTPTISIDLNPDNGTFVDTLVSLPGVQNGSADWGDCNNDGAFDVLLTGQVSSTLKIARVYQQQIGGTFALAASFPEVVHGATAWGDYDNDGWLDIALTGENAIGPIAQLYRNEHTGTTCSFSAVTANLVGVRHSAAAWGDYNADGQLDLLLAGNDGSEPVTKIYRNDRGSFTDSGLSLPGIQSGAATWGDYDSDGWIDLLLTGTTAGDAPLTGVYRNDGHGALIDIRAGLPALSDSAAAWGDYDSDGDLDLLLEGTTSAGPQIAEIYRNDQGVFVKNNEANNLMGGLTWSGAAWGDYDTDGYLDVLISSDSFAKAYRNEITGSFATGIPVGLSLVDGTAAWGHYDTDRNLDVLLTGRSVQGPVSRIYKYSNYSANTPPEAPTNLAAVIAGADVKLRWSPPMTDDHTLLPGLSYNLRIGTQPGGVDVIAPMAITDTGYRLLPALGNGFQAQTFTLRNLAMGRKYYWSVQAIDTSFAGSNFAAESTFQIPYRVFLPTVLKDFVSYYANEWETEPNNTYLQSNGPLESGRTYRGVHNDERDYYSAYLRDTGTLTVEMASLSGGTQIQLFYQIADVAHRVGFDPTPPYQIEHTGSPGWYYIYVYTNPVFVGTETYTLSVTYP